jgi:hypothetical protein
MKRAIIQNKAAKLNPRICGNQGERLIGLLDKKCPKHGWEAGHGLAAWLSQIGPKSLSRESKRSKELKPCKDS